MPLTQEQELNEYELRVEQMNANIEKIHRDMKLDDKRYRIQFWTMLLQAVALVVGAFAAGAAWMRYIH